MRFQANRYKQGWDEYEGSPTASGVVHRSEEDVQPQGISQNSSEGKPRPQMEPNPNKGSPNEVESETYEGKRSEAEHWKSNHDEQVRRKHVVQELLKAALLRAETAEAALTQAQQERKSMSPTEVKLRTSKQEVTIENLAPHRVTPAPPQTTISAHPWDQLHSRWYVLMGEDAYRINGQIWLGTEAEAKAKLESLIGEK